MNSKPSFPSSTSEKGGYRFDLSLHGVFCRLVSGHTPFVDYAASYLSGLACEPSVSPGILAHLWWNTRPPEGWNSPDIQRRGRRLFQSEDRLLFSEIAEAPGLQIEAGWRAGRFEIDAYYQVPSRLALYSKTAQVRLYAVLVYYLVYFPLVWVLNQLHGWHLLHAGAVSRPEGALILAGLPGSGKSTLTLGLMEDSSTRLLSDNLLLFDHSLVYALPEPLHTSPRSLDALSPKTRRLLVDEGREYSHGRRDFNLPLELRARQSKPLSLAFVGLAGKLARIPLDRETALERLLGFDQMAKETSAYAQFAAALALIKPVSGGTAGHNLSRMEVLRSLIGPLDCFELWMEPGRSLSEAGLLAWQRLERGDDPHGSYPRADSPCRD